MLAQSGVLTDASCELCPRPVLAQVARLHCEGRACRQHSPLHRSMCLTSYMAYPQPSPRGHAIFAKE